VRRCGCGGHACCLTIIVSAENILFLRHVRSALPSSASTRHLPWFSNQYAKATTSKNLWSARYALNAAQFSAQNPSDAQSRTYSLVNVWVSKQACGMRRVRCIPSLRVCARWAVGRPGSEAVRLGGVR
jgi:hypothetical protein